MKVEYSTFGLLLFTHSTLEGIENLETVKMMVNERIGVNVKLVGAPSEVERRREKNKKVSFAL